MFDNVRMAGVARAEILKRIRRGGWRGKGTKSWSALSIMIHDGI